MKTADQLRFERLIADMDIPEMRRDSSKPENVRWFLRNVLFRNSKHKDVDVAISLASKLL